MLKLLLSDDSALVPDDVEVEVDDAAVALFVEAAPWAAVTAAESRLAVDAVEVVLDTEVTVFPVLQAVMLMPEREKSDEEI
ncbi:hypothetical protein AOE01nite_00420 [Acetobacter oeni]|uniref:Uncharacterized protein n=1 Tax=Acetobacter oeni TaxID=304077 RepID=A0A511XFW7_9PROT|nr:hypothetical protein AA21952_0337 [Acetobacter oeni LMG 21952]GEN61818.1 hypothetical protein AOE01nite_00420 [Acetobacter oeni]